MRYRELTEADQERFLAKAKSVADQFEKGHRAAGPADRFVWHYDPAYPMARFANDKARIIEFMRNEIQAWAEEGEPDRFDDMLGVPIKEPIIVVEVDGASYTWDGNHRLGAAFLNDATTIPAIIGVPKPPA